MKEKNKAFNRIEGMVLLPMNLMRQKPIPPRSKLANGDACHAYGCNIDKLLKKVKIVSKEWTMLYTDGSLNSICWTDRSYLMEGRIKNAFTVVIVCIFPL